MRDRFCTLLIRMRNMSKTNIMRVRQLSLCDVILKIHKPEECTYKSDWKAWKNQTSKAEAVEVTQFSTTQITCMCINSFSCMFHSQKISQQHMPICSVYGLFTKKKLGHFVWSNVGIHIPYMPTNSYKTNFVRANVGNHIPYHELPICKPWC